MSDRVAACVATISFGAVASNYSRNFTGAQQKSDAGSHTRFSPSPVSAAELTASWVDNSSGQASFQMRVRNATGPLNCSSERQG